MKRTPEELDKLIDKVGRNDIVCDSLNKCKGWEKSYKRLSDSIEFFDKCFGGPYTGLSFTWCPWCGSKIDWEIEKEIAEDLRKEVK